MGPELIVAAAATLGLVVIVAPPRVARATLLSGGVGGLAARAAIAAVPSLDLVFLVLLVLAVLQARLVSTSDFAARLRAPVLAIALLSLGLAVERMQGPTVLERFGAVGLVAGLVAAVGLLPFVHQFDPEESVIASPIPWIA